MSSRAPLSVISSADSSADDLLALEEDAETQQDFSEFSQFLDSLDAERGGGNEERKDSNPAPITDASSSKTPLVAKDDHPSALSTTASAPSAPTTSGIHRCSKCYGKAQCPQPALNEPLLQLFKCFANWGIPAC